jgi:hypothetical protein
LPSGPILFCLKPCSRWACSCIRGPTVGPKMCTTIIIAVITKWQFIIKLTQLVKFLLCDLLKHFAV